MKNIKLKILIPTIYLLVIIVFTMLVQVIIGYNTHGQNGLYEFLYTLSFFVSKPIYSIIYMLVLLFPFGLLIYSSIKKQRHLIVSSLSCIVISLVLLASIFIIN